MLEILEKYNKPDTPTEYYVIWLHGLGADCHDFAPLVPELKLTKAVKFIFPNAPMIPISLNNGYVMRGWYDIKSLDRINHVIDNDGIDKSVTVINRLIENLVNSGIDSKKIFLAGFSQGGVISYTTALRTSYKLAGVLALSCYLPNANKLSQLDTINKATPILAIHGKNDHVVPYDVGLAAYTELKTAGFNITWREYMMEHSVCADEINDIHKWFLQIFAAVNPLQV